MAGWYLPRKNGKILPVRDIIGNNREYPSLTETEKRSHHKIDDWKTILSFFNDMVFQVRAAKLRGRVTR